MTNAIQIEGLTKSFGTTTALAGVDLSVPAGRVLGVLGPNGAGKTTLVRILATLLLPDRGSVRVGPYDVVRDSHQARALTGLTGQYAAVDEVLSGFENLWVVGRLLGLSRAETKRRAGELLSRLGLAEAAGRPVRTYSGGMRRRLDLATSLVSQPRVLFLDEPTTGLDPRSRGELWELVRELVIGGTTVLLTTQYLEEADRLADEIVIIDRGRIVASGTANELKTRVGGQTLVVRPRHQVDLPVLRDLAASICGGAPRIDGDQVLAAIADPAVSAVLAQRLESAGVPVAELALREVSLDEVFLAITGTGDRSPACPQRTVG
ncbi:ATP-binding cassette domain-containing protein [Amycolatopsis cihanbeyliensis]|uniref:Oleandomycin transport system ATP-binding protein n=1 Tax=Amycolatopsis cihanbeyliensis TaxID=1128664 RepID=A0A542DBQ0_AMYCI|nr:ATP-binding cassette domain-containing protein [Amycolatopsis cihanbeyliensis]TQJ00508.1 oleandomycin transport system ATP-binding protein [Amycolatopsis cihanbeyliensis]